jgi:predicted HTH transcriptional regulator
VFKTIVPLPKLDENLEEYDGNRVGNDGNSDGNDGNIDGNIKENDCNSEGNDGNTDGKDGDSEGNLVPHPSYTLLSLLRNNPTATYAELAISLGISEATVTRRIKKLKEANKIERIGSTHGKWVVTEN